jgi:hypothetical protein
VAILENIPKRSAAHLAPVASCSILRASQHFREAQDRFVVLQS